jgi:hypothetical protein
MSIGRRWQSATLIVTSFLVAGLTIGCDDAPTKEIQQAQQAIDTAHSAGADRYAPDEFNGALDALKRAQAAVTGKDYRQALNDALDARDRAQTAAKDATDRKSAAKVDVDRSLHDAALSLVDARAKLRTAETARRSQRVIAPVRRAIADAETHVQEARTKFDSGDYLDAGTLLTKTRAELDESVRILEGAARK